MTNNNATTWAQAAANTRAIKASTKDQKPDTEPVKLTSEDIDVENGEDGDAITLALGDTVYTMSLDTATDFAGRLAEANPNVDTEKVGGDDGGK